MPEKPKVLNVNMVARSRIFKLEQVDLQFSNGVRRVYERIAGREGFAVFVIALKDPQTLLLAREYAVGREAYELGVVKGFVEAGEEKCDAAVRELKEEIGYGAKQTRYLFDFCTSPGYIASHYSVVLAWDLYPCKLAGDEPEPVECVEWPLADLDQLVERDDVTDARVIAALLRFEKWFKRYSASLEIKGETP